MTPARAALALRKIYSRVGERARPQNLAALLPFHVVIKIFLDIVTPYESGTWLDFCQSLRTLHHWGVSMTTETSRRPDDLLTLRDCEIQYPISKTTIRKRVTEGRLPAQRIAGRIVVRRGDLEELFEPGPWSKRAGA